jgi:hypothetical protein
VTGDIVLKLPMALSPPFREVTIWAS